MQIAIDEARVALETNDIPIGCVIVDKDNNIITKSSNRVEDFQNCTAHAEILAISEACKIINSKYLTGCSMYITLEPCVMCACAISHARISRLYIGATDYKFGGITNGMIYNKNKINHIPEVYFSIMEKECKDLLNNFFISLRC